MDNLAHKNLFDLTHFEHAKMFEPFKYPWEVLRYLTDYFKEIKLGECKGEVSSQAYIINPELIYIGKGAVVEPGAYIRGPCYLDDGCVVRHGAYIRGYVIAGKESVIGHDTEIKNSILLNHAHAAHFAYVGDSLLGNRVNLGAGTKCANLRLDSSEVVVHFEGKKIATGLRKLGAVLGDDTQLGCNVVTNPGTITAKRVWVFPGINFGGFISEGAKVKWDCSVRIC